MIDKSFNLIETIKSIESSSKDVREFVSTVAESIALTLNELNRNYRVFTDWSVDPFESPILVSVSVYIESNGLKAFVDKLYAEDLCRAIEAERLISKCDRAYQMYFVN